MYPFLICVTKYICLSQPYSNNIVEFRRRVRAALLNNATTCGSGPMVVHCKSVIFIFQSQTHYLFSLLCIMLCYLRFSDGGGRSGVFMAIDANLEAMEEDGVFDIFGYMKKLRQARRGLVELLVNWIFYLSSIFYQC